jgi:CubicO group peptidase (beta-lactamase class C family)
MKYRIILTAIVLAASTPSAATSQTAATPKDAIQKVDELFAKTSTDMPGCAVGIAQKGKTVVERAYGAADLEHGIANTPAAIFESGSVAKQFTAAAVLLLVQDGKLKLSDDIRKYLPEMPDYGDVITIQHLLDHTSGLRDWGSVANASGKPRGERTFSQKEVLEIASRQKNLNYKPGAEYSYTNTGYNLAAEIVARVSGKSFPDFTRERIFVPLGMTHSQWRDDFNRIVKGRAVAYVPAAGGFRQSMPFMNVYGNGGMLTTIGDFLIWNEALTQNKLGSAITKGLEQKSVLNDGREIIYARGLMVQTYKGATEVSHSGSTGGYTTWLARYPEQGLSVAMLCNGPPPGNFALPRQLADVFLPPTPSAPSATVALPAGAPSLAGLFVNTASGVPLRIILNGETLQSAQIGAPPLPMMQVSNGRWTMGAGTPLGATATFSGADRFTLDALDGNRFEYARTAPVQPTAEQLAEFAGTYASDETGAAYKIAIESGQLVLLIDRWPATEMKLAPSYKDAFLSGSSLIRFYRDSTGRVTQMSWGDNRMRDLRAPRVR